MFEHFKLQYKVTSRVPANPSGASVTSPLEDTPGYARFMQDYAGTTFNDGVYRVHTVEGRAKWTRLIEEAFPRFRGKISAFGCDWVGRQFALDSGRREGGEPLVAMFEPDTGVARQVPASFVGFHDQTLVEDSDAALADIAFEEWLQGGHRAPQPTECVGFKVPLFLGGVDDFENYELTDMEVYWDVSTQLLAKVRDLPEGTPIGRVKIE